MKKRKTCNLNFNVVRIASLSKIHILTGGGDDITFEPTCDDQGQTNTNGTSKILRKCPVIGSKVNCLSDDC